MSPRLLAHVASIEARRRMSYRADFWVNAVVGFAAEFGLAWFLWTALYRESGQEVIAGYTLDTMIVYYVAVILFAKIVRGTEFDAHVSLDIYEGGLNRYLVFPTSYFAFKYAQHIGSLLPALIQLVLFGGLWWIVSGEGGGAAVTPGGILMCIVSLALANLLYYAMSFPLHAVAFWADNVWSLIVALRFATSLLGGLMFPLALLPDAFRSANEWLPFRCLFAVPVEALMGRISFEAWLQAMAVGAGWLLVLLGVARAIWRRGNLQYSGIGM